MSIIIFPEAPSPTVPITFLDDTDLDVLLIEFPNHLVIPTVMEHFCPPLGARNSESLGYIAKKMAERLSIHRNIWNELDFDASDRIGNLVSWIRRLKKAANAARRRRVADGGTAQLVPFEGQCLDDGSEQEGDGVANGEVEDDGGAPTPLGLRLQQRFEDTLAEYRQMMLEKAGDSTTHGTQSAGEASGEER